MSFSGYPIYSHTCNKNYDSSCLLLSFQIEYLLRWNHFSYRRQNSEYAKPPHLRCWILFVRRSLRCPKAQEWLISKKEKKRRKKAKSISSLITSINWDSPDYRTYITHMDHGCSRVACSARVSGGEEWWEWERLISRGWYGGMLQEGMWDCGNSGK